jgi:glycine/D-amino acid oxidase-like deaminating enzyme
VRLPDTLVVGGGLIGVLTACELASRGARVTVLEKDDIGFEQSGRSVAAVNLPGGEPNAGSSLLRVSAEHWAAFEDRWNDDIGLNREGWFVVVADDEDRGWLDVERATWQETAGFPETRLLDAAAARDRFPQLEGDLLGVDVRHGGHVDAVLVMDSLRRTATRLGVDLRCGEMATGFSVRGEHITVVRTTNGSFSPGVVVVAAGLWSPELAKQLGLHIPMQRVRAPAIETQPMPAGTIPGFLRASRFGAKQKRDGTIRVTGGYRFSAMLHDLSLTDFRDLRTWMPAFWQNRKDVSLRVDLASLRSEVSAKAATLRAHNGDVFVPRGQEPRSNPRDRVTQLSELKRLIPTLGGAQIRRSFSGVMDLIPDLQPVVGRFPEVANAYDATGFSGHGFMCGPGACQAVAELVSDGYTSIDLRDYSPDRLKRRLKMREQVF